MLFTPVVAAVATFKLIAPVIERPKSSAIWTLWVAVLVVVSLVASLVVQRLMRRLPPLSFLFGLSLVFPERAPTRLAVALRSMSGQLLELSLCAGAFGPGSEQEAAERVVAFLARLSHHDRTTRGHSERVRAYSIMIGEELGLAQDDLDKLNWAALIHDIGKLDVLPEILGKLRPLNGRDRAALRRHPAQAVPYVEALLPWLGEWIFAATEHHERWDGQGYPAGRAGENISLGGRIVAVADAYDVMTCPRSYKPALPAHEARAELTRNAGTQFDPAVVRAFLQISVGKVRWVLGPTGWLSHLPDVMQGPATTVATTSTGLISAGAVVAAGGRWRRQVGALATAESTAAIERQVSEPATNSELPGT
jgi:HD-GYP domain-containing protein (c-di-GMP phosphodiesterase class II)